MLCHGSLLKFDLFLGGRLIKKQAEIRLVLSLPSQERFDLAQLLREHLEIEKPLSIQVYTDYVPPTQPIVWHTLKKHSTLEIDCEGLRELRQGYLAINLVTTSTAGCDRSFVLFVDLFSNGILVKENTLLQLVYDKVFSDGSAATDLLEAARLAMMPKSNRVMGRIYLTEKQPPNPALIPWDSLGTYVTDEKPALVTCPTVLEYQQKYVAINLAPVVCQDTTLTVHLFWRGTVLREGEEQQLPIHFTHGERQFGESTVDLAEVAHAAIPKELHHNYRTRVQLFNSRLPPKEVIYWKSRKPPRSHLIVTCDQVKQLQQDWIALNVEPVLRLKCDLCHLDALFHHRVSNQLFCSLSCYETFKEHQ